MGANWPQKCGGYLAHTNVTTLYRTLCILLFGCQVSLCAYSMHVPHTGQYFRTMWCYSDHFFCLVCRLPWEKRKKDKIITVLSHRVCYGRPSWTSGHCGTKLKIFTICNFTLCLSLMRYSLYYTSTTLWSAKPQWHVYTPHSTCNAATCIRMHRLLHCHLGSIKIRLGIAH